jgi:polyhydroxyalkanoate synthesis regulator phasin
MIRTRLVELSTLDAIAFRRKVRGGHTAIIIQRYDGGQPGQALLNRNTGEADPAQNTEAERYPSEAFAEAVELTLGLPFTARGQVKISGSAQKAGEPEPDDQDDADEVATVCSREYAAIVEAYTNKKGELSYELLNKDFIQFMKSSKLVDDMVANGASADQIRDYVVRVKLENLTGNKDLSDGQVQRIVEMLDEVSPRNVFRDLNDEIRKLLAR